MFGLGEAGCIRQLAPDTGLSKWVPLCAVFGISQLRALNGLQQLHVTHPSRTSHKTLKFSILCTNVPFQFSLVCDFTLAAEWYIW